MFGTQPSSVPAGQYPLVMGADGRYDGVLRRYPGHARYADSNGVLGSTNLTDVEFSRYFEISKEAGSQDRIRGCIVSDSSGNIELWYRLSTDSSGVLRRQLLSEVPQGLWEINTSTKVASPMSRGGVIGGIPSTPLTSFAISEMVWHDDGTTGGPVLYVATEMLLGGTKAGFGRAGSRHCSGIARLVNGAWEPVGLPAFTGGAIRTLYSNGADGNLYAGGLFTEYDGADCKGFATWDGKKWTQYGEGIDTTTGHIYAITDTWIGGTFTKLGDGTLTNGPVAKYAGGVITVQSGIDQIGISSGTPVVVRLAVHSNKTFAYGQFDQDGAGNAISPDNLAVYNSSTGWDTVPNGPSFPSGIAADNGAQEYRNGDLFTWSPPGGSERLYCLLYGDGSGEDSTLFAYDWAVGAGSTTVVGEADNNWRARTLFADASHMYIGGSQTSFDGVASWGLHRWDGALPGTFEAITGLKASAGADAVYVLGQGPDGTIAVGAEHTDQTTAPLIRSGEFWDVCSWGPYLFLLCSNGNHKVISWDSATSLLTVSAFGPVATWLPKPLLTNSWSSGGVSGVGWYQSAVRYVDRKRARYSAMSLRGADKYIAPQSVMPDPPEGGWYRIEDPDPVIYPPLELPDLQFFTTLASGSDDVRAGGTLYRVGEGGAAGEWGYDVYMFSVDSKDNGRGVFEMNLTDDMISADLSRAYDVLREDVTELGRCYACAFYQGTTFVLEAWDTYLRVRWSSTLRHEPENFPLLNSFLTEIRTVDGATCRLIAVGDYLFAVGGNRIYRIQRVGENVSIIELYRGFPILHKNGMVAAGNRLFVATERGLLVLDAVNGALQPMPGLDRLFHDRWRSKLEPGDTTNAVLMGYDSKMRCVYLHHKGLDETWCIWPDTGKLTMLPYHAVGGIVVGEDLDTESSERCYFIGESAKWLETPNWDLDVDKPQVLNGVELYASQNRYRYNADISGVSSAGSPLRTVLSLGDHGAAAAPFTTDGTTIKTITPCYVIFLTGAQQYKAYLAESNTADSLTLNVEITSDPPVAGDIVALSPIVFGAVGSSLWAPRGTPVPMNRKIVTGMHCLPQRLSSTPSNHEQLAPATTGYGLLRYGTLRHDDLISGEPFSGIPRDALVLHGSAETTAGAALDIDRPDKQTVHFRSDGTLLYPAILCYQSNFGIELHHWEVSGELSGMRISG